MSRVRNVILVPSYGKDESKFHRVPEFEAVSRTRLFKTIIPDFRMAGKVRDFVNENRLAVRSFGTDFNGYGYTTQNNWYLLRPKDSKIVLDMLSHNEANKRAVPTEEEKTAAWCRRLAKLTGIKLEQAMAIAEEKIEDKDKRIEVLEERQWRLNCSIQREKLINKIRRSNPLRYIKDKDHAFRILAASVRHNESDYESMLEEARELASWGEIDRDEVKSYARQHTTYYKDIQSTYFGDEEDEDDGIDWDLVYRKIMNKTGE